MAETGFWRDWNLSYLPTDIFGNLFGGHSVQEATYRTLMKWVPTYIYAMNRKLGVDVLEVPRRYRYRPTYRTLPKDKAPAILVVVPGTTGTPERFQTKIRSTWSVELNTFVFGGQDWKETQALVLAYTTCFRALLLQQGTLGTFANTTKWMTETYKEYQHSATRTSGLGTSTFQVTVDNTMDPYGGPPVEGYGVPGSWIPSMFPPAPEPQVEEVNVELTNEVA